MPSSHEGDTARHSPPETEPQSAGAADGAGGNGAGADGQADPDEEVVDAEFTRG
jgi:hypothetical protein